MCNLMSVYQFRWRFLLANQSLKVDYPNIAGVTLPLDWTAYRSSMVYVYPFAFWQFLCLQIKLKTCVLRGGLEAKWVFAPWKSLEMILNSQLLQGLMFAAEVYGWNGTVDVMAPLTTPCRNR